MNKRINIAICTLLVFGLLACSDFQKIVKSSDYEMKYLEADRQFQKETYSRALTLYEQIYQHEPKSAQGELAYYRMAECYFLTGDYYMANYYFSNFAIRFPASDKVENALFYNAICTVKQSPKATLDQVDTEKALVELQNFIQHFPNSKYIDTCNNIMDNLRLKIETKRFNAVQLYSKTENYRAAVSSAKAFIEDYPQSHFWKEAILIHYENAYILAINSILSRQKERIENAMELYNKYQPYFEDSPEAKKTSRYYHRLQKDLKLVDEKYAFQNIEEAYEMSNTTSEHKKMHYLEETIKRFNNFAKLYPNSTYLDKAENFKRKAQRELEKDNS